MVVGPSWGWAGQTPAPRFFGAAEPSCMRRSSTAPWHLPQPLLPHTAPPQATTLMPPTLTGGRLSLPAAWILPRSSPAVSRSHRGTASLSSVGGEDRRYEGSARMDQPPASPLPPQPCWVAQTCSTEWWSLCSVGGWQAPSPPQLICCLVGFGTDPTWGASWGPCHPCTHPLDHAILNDGDA